jgi:hypothetical protein
LHQSQRKRAFTRFSSETKKGSGRARQSLFPQDNENPSENDGSREAVKKINVPVCYVNPFKKSPEEESKDMSNDIIPFGKYRGKPLEAMASDRQYVEWVLTQPWFRERYKELHTIIINNFQEPSETPEHNAIQVLFLEDSYREAFIRAIPNIIKREVSEFRSSLDERYRSRQEKIDELQKSLTWWMDRLRCNKEDREVSLTKSSRQSSPDDDYYEKRIHEIETEIREKLENHEAKASAESVSKYSYSVTIQSEAAYEQKAIDAIIQFTITICPTDASIGSMRSHKKTLTIEIKPNVGDDYPAILRQMLSNGADYLFLESYTGIGATESQFRKVFQASGKKVVFRHEVDACLNNPL